MIVILVDALNDLDILAGYIHNKDLNAETKEKFSFMRGKNRNMIKGKWWLL